MFHVLQQFLKISKQLCAVNCFLLFRPGERKFLLRGTQALWYATLLLRAGALRSAEPLRVPLYAENRKMAVAQPLHYPVVRILHIRNSLTRTVKALMMGAVYHKAFTVIWNRSPS